jgi:hypothetical protein
MDNEVFFDMDEPDWDMLRLYTQPLLNYLDEHNIPYILAGSGGKGIHLSCWFDALEYQKMYGFREVRLALWNYILNEIGVDESLKGEGRPYCNAVVNFGDTVQFGKILREFGGNKNGNYKTMVDHVPFIRKKMYQKGCVFPDKVSLWTVPLEILESFEFKPRHKNYPLSCSICPVDKDFIYQQSHYIDDWGRLKVKVNPCTNCEGCV